MSNQRNTYLIRTLLVILIVFLVNIAGQYFHTFVDLSEDKRFTLSESTLDMVRGVDNVIFIKVLLDGEFPAGFKRLRAEVIERLNQFRAENPLIEYTFEDPSVGSVDEINARRQRFKEMGMAPTSLTVFDGDQRIDKIIFPYAMINFGSRTNVVNLLEPQSQGGQEEALANSINLLEYKLANGIQKLLKTELPNIVFSSGHGELPDYMTARLEGDLNAYYNTGRLNLDSLYQLNPSDVDLLIVPAPRTAVPAKTQFVIDQYIMNGGKVIWLVENFEVNLDSINVHQMYVPKPIEHGLDDMLFKYGVRVKKDLLLDLECSQIPQVVGYSGEKAQTSLFPWYYHPLSASKSNHPVVKGIDRVNFKFPSGLDTIRTDGNVRKEVLLSTSEYSRFQIYPMRINFEILKVEPDVNKFNKGSQNIAVLLEGEFESYFKNKVTAENENILKQIGAEFKALSVPTKQLVVSDADFLKNQYDPGSNRISPIGYNPWERKTYEGNAAFITNAIEYMLDDYGLLDARGKDFKMRLLDKVKTGQEKTKWQMINIVLPILLVWIFALVFYYWRKKKYVH